MTPRSRPILAAAAVVTAGLLTGCAGAQPGVAARVGDQTVSVREVNRLTDGFCLAIERSLEGEGTVLPMNVIAGTVVQVLAMNAATEQLAEEYDVEPTATFRQTRAEIEASNAVIRPESAAEASTTLRTGSAYATDIITSIGLKTLEEDGVVSPSQDDGLARGKDILSTWLAENEPEIDPQYHLRIGELQPETVDTSTSYAASKRARDGLLGDVFAVSTLDETQDADFRAHARSLPDSQRCG